MVNGQWSMVNGQWSMVNGPRVDTKLRRKKKNRSSQTPLSKRKGSQVFGLGDSPKPCLSDKRYHKKQSYPTLSPKSPILP
ncbi:hypothetical protein EYC84_007007 [Monilinia fructicola]|uniref:Uncharacterized protein n=1 Tax=Monilinia fructicola TaxID=38448 RepID=A0A5M9KA59_MONFR|nr:hypothetical protein EYC84_007007 [Monilinia fructicola]